jgi:hypothetical protein
MLVPVGWCETIHPRISEIAEEFEITEMSDISEMSEE